MVLTHNLTDSVLYVQHFTVFITLPRLSAMHKTQHNVRLSGNDTALDSDPALYIQHFIDSVLSKKPIIESVLYSTFYGLSANDTVLDTDPALHIQHFIDQAVPFAKLNRLIAIHAMLHRLSATQAALYRLSAIHTRFYILSVIHTTVYGLGGFLATFNRLSGIDTELNCLSAIHTALYNTLWTQR